jgi:general L-amino acid transport system permease protein
MKRPASEEGYELTLGEPEGPAAQVAPEAVPATPGEWVRKNLFSSFWSGMLTVVTALLAAWILAKAIGFVFVDADWSVLKANLRVYMVGRFPLEEMWRVWTDVYVIALLAGLSRGVQPAMPWTLRRVVRWALILGVAVAVLLYLVESSRVLLLLAATVALMVAGAAIGRRLGRVLRKPLIVAWILAFPFVVILLRGFGGVKPENWGGFLLNVIVAVVAIFVSFPIGLLLALGRRSTLPVVRTFSVGFIEFIRGVPLVTLLIFGVFAFELLLPPGLRLPNIVLAMIMFVVFSSAYVAEIVRGGLQGVPEGQYEASRALGLRYPRMMRSIVLPQALRNTIPSMISHFISLFKDTSLLVGVGLFSDLLSNAGRATRDLAFVGLEAEALLPAAFMFWAVAYAMARWSQRVEKRVGVGER